MVHGARTLFIKYKNGIYGPEIPFLFKKKKRKRVIEENRSSVSVFCTRFLSVIGIGVSA